METNNEKTTAEDRPAHIVRRGAIAASVWRRQPDPARGTHGVVASVGPRQLAMHF